MSTPPDPRSPFRSFHRASTLSAIMGAAAALTLCAQVSLVHAQQPQTTVSDMPAAAASTTPPESKPAQPSPTPTDPGRPLESPMPAEAPAKRLPPPDRTILNLSYYVDSRDYNSMNLLLESNALPWGFNIFGFTDLLGTEGAPSERFDLTRFYHEYRIRRPLDDVPFLDIKGFDVELEYNDSDLPNDAVVRFAIGYQHSVLLFLRDGSWLQWRVLPWQSNGAGWQLSLTHFLVLSERFMLIGFADYNVVNHGPDQWIAESELSFTVNETFDLIIEGRYNGFEEAIPGLAGVGVAGGLRIKL